MNPGGLPDFACAQAIMSLPANPTGKAYLTGVGFV